MKNIISLKIVIHLLIMRPVVKLLFGINLFGKENINRLDRFIIIANHNSHLDTLLLFSMLPSEKISITHPVAAEEYFSKSKLIFRLVNYLFSPVWIDREDASSRPEFFENVHTLLESGHNLIMFPEGTRGLPGEMQSFKTGIGRIAQQFPDIPIVPVYLQGPERAFPKSGYVPIPIWNNIIIGPAHTFHKSYHEITEILEKTIHELAENEIACRHKRIQKKHCKMKTIAVLGIDGSGKSTLSREIAGELSADANVALVSDTLQLFEHKQLKSMQPLITENIRGRISRYAKNAKSLKLYKIPKLTELLLRDILLVEVKRWFNPDITVLDGSPLLNLTSWAILYKENYFNEKTTFKAIKILSSNDKDISQSDVIYKDLPELSMLKKLRLTHLNLPDIVIFLNVDPKIAIARINKRGEKKQVHETEEKLSKLQKAYHVTCKITEQELNIPTLIIPGNDSIENINRYAIKFINDHLQTEAKNEKNKN